jgi:hypothetical protein
LWISAEVDGQTTTEIIVIRQISRLDDEPVGYAGQVCPAVETGKVDSALFATEWQNSTWRILDSRSETEDERTWT